MRFEVDVQPLATRFPRLADGYGDQLSADATALVRSGDDGVRVVLLQVGPFGGDCTFVGCVPSNTLIEAAGQGADFASAMVRAAVAQIAANETAGVLRTEGIDVVEGSARLEGADRVVVDGRHLRARRLDIATGTGPVIPAIPGPAGV